MGAGSHMSNHNEEIQPALERCRDLLRQFIEHAPAPIAMFDRDMRYIMASRRFATDYNLKSQDLIGRSHYEVFPEIPERWKAIHRRCLAGATERAEEDPFPRADGTLDWVRWEIQPWYEANGAIGGIILFSEVITAHKQADESLRQSEEKYRTLVEVSRDAIFVNHNNQIIYVNPAAVKLFGADRPERIIGKSPFDLFHPEYHELIRERIKSLLDTDPCVHRRGKDRAT
jgi:PAS domain S-box-containing protein